MRTLFYMIGVLPIVWELYCVGNPRMVRNFIDEIRIKSKAGEDMNSKENTLLFLQLGYAIWCIIGIFSSQWVLFSMVLLLSLIPKKHYTMTFIDSLISCALLVFIILNRQHFHIDVWSYIKDYFS